MALRLGDIGTDAWSRIVERIEGEALHPRVETTIINSIAAYYLSAFPNLLDGFRCTV